jgi:hypothetical protein
VKISLPQGKVLNGTFYISRWTGCRRKAPPKERLPKTASERNAVAISFLLPSPSIEIRRPLGVRRLHASAKIVGLSQDCSGFLQPQSPLKAPRALAATPSRICQS